MNIFFPTAVLRKVAEWKARKEAILRGESSDTTTITEAETDIYAVPEDTLV